MKCVVFVAQSSRIWVKYRETVHVCIILEVIFATSWLLLLH